MKKAKMLMLPIVAAMALLALAGTASATTLTTPEGTTPTIKSASEGHIVLHNPIVKIECQGAVEGKVESHGAGIAATGKVTSTTFTSCTNSWHVTTIANGTAAFTANKENSTVVSSGLTVEATRFGVICRYATNNTTIGLATQGAAPTTHVQFNIPLHSGSLLCGSSPVGVTGSYKVVSPSSITPDK